MKRGQTSTEYLILLSIVIVVAIIILVAIGGFDLMDSSVEVNSNNAKLLSGEIGVTNYAVSNSQAKLKLINNRPWNVILENIKIKGGDCNITSLPLKIGEEVIVICNISGDEMGVFYEYDFELDYYDTFYECSYKLTNLKLMGTISDNFESETTEVMLGTPENPFPITNCVLFDEIRNNLSAYYYLDSDLDCTGVIDPGPMGSFSGGLDGGGHTINGIEIDDTAEFVALFNETSEDAFIRNIFFTNATVVGSENAAVLVGINRGTIENTGVGANVEGHGYVGGLVSVNYGNIVNSTATVNGTTSGHTNFLSAISGYNNGTIDGCISFGELVSGGKEKYIGGIVGYNDGLVINSISITYSRGSGNENYDGGLIGYNTGTLSTSYSLSSISTNGNDKYAGGAVGYNAGTIWMVYASGDYSAVGNRNEVGGLVGDNAGFISASYYDEDNTTCTPSCGDSQFGVSYINLINSTWLELQGWTFPPWVDTPSYPALYWE